MCSHAHRKNNFKKIEAFAQAGDEVEMLAEHLWMVALFKLLYPALPPPLCWCLCLPQLFHVCAWKRVEVCSPNLWFWHYTYKFNFLHADISFFYLFWNTLWSYRSQMVPTKRAYMKTDIDVNTEFEYLKQVCVKNYFQTRVGSLLWKHFFWYQWVASVLKCQWSGVSISDEIS